MACARPSTRRRHRFRHRRGVRPIVVLLPLLAYATGCRDRGQPPPRSTEGDRPAIEESSPTRYSSTFAFAGTVPTATRLYLELLNETSSDGLFRRYRGWIAPADAGWSEILVLSDTIPVARAAWRVLPGPGLDVLIGDDSEILELRLSDSTGRLRVRPTRGIAEWTGPTGQRELLALGVLSRDSVSQPGVLYFRRAARAAVAPGDRGADLLLLLGDARGNGLFVGQTEADTATRGFAWGWIDGSRLRWSDVVLRPLRDGLEPGEPPAAARWRSAEEPAAGSTRWRLEMPLAGIEGELWIVGAVDAERLSRSGSGPVPSAAARPRLQDPPPGAYLVEGTLEMPGGARTVRGILLHGPLP